MKIISFWNVDANSDLEEGFYLTVNNEKRGLEILQQLADVQKRDYYAVFYEVEEWLGENVGKNTLSKRTLEWFEENNATYLLRPNQRYIKE